MTIDTTRVKLEVEFYPATQGVDWARKVREKVGLQGGWLRIRNIYHEMEYDEMYGIGVRVPPSRGDAHTTVECEYYPDISRDDEPRV